MSELIDQMREALRSRHYSRRTEQAYCLWVRRFTYFHGNRHPATLAEPEINAFLTHLAVTEKVSASTQTQALSALLFLYRNILGQPVGELGELIRAKESKRLPVGKPDWDIGEAQPDLRDAIAQGVIRGSVLDVGCGTGDNAVFLASRGFSVTGVDVSAKAIALAQRKARSASVDASFVTLDAFKLATLAETFDTVIDFGLFHQFDGELRARYVRSLHHICGSQGRLLLQCFSDQGTKAERFGPRLVSQDELHSSFSAGWRIEWIRPASYKCNGNKSYPAWLALILRTESG